MSTANAHLQWVLGYSQRKAAENPNTWIADYRLSDLMNKGYITRRDGLRFLTESGLVDFHWQMIWPEDFDIPDEYLVDRLANVQGYVIFIHGWTGNLGIWEEIPSMVVQSERQLVAISIDHNGFGLSLFEENTPSLERCNPPAAMVTLQRWVDLMKLRRQPGSTQNKVLNFVGHSMGAATLFYMNPLLWNYGEATRLAIAPALLLEDEGHRLFYTTLGIGIGILQRVPVLEVVERFIKPGMINTLVAGASDLVKQIHSNQYAETPRGITGATFMAMGRLNNYEIAHEYKLMRVILGHRDPLVGLVDMMDLLCKLEFPAANLHVLPGTHYLFSVGTETHLNAYQHAQNRELVVEDILDLHYHALDMQKRGPRLG